MPTHEERGTFAYDRRGHYLGIEDAIGHVYHTGTATFVNIKYDWTPSKGVHETSESPSRLYRIYQPDADDEDEAEPEDAIEHAFCWDYKSIEKVAGYDDVIDQAILNEMRDDPRAYLESDLVISDEGRSIVSDVSVYRTSDEIPATDSHAIRILGKVSLSTTGEDDAPKITGVTSFERRTAHTKLEAMTPRPDLIVKPRLVQPCAADDHRCHLAVHVERGGGPELTHLNEGEILELGADDERIFVIKYQKQSSAAVKHAYVVGDPYADPLDAVVVYTRDELAALPSLDDATAKLLRMPATRRHFLRGDGHDELVPGTRRVKVPRAAILEQIVMAAPPLLEGLRVHYSPGKVFRFEVVSNANGKLTACARVSASRALAAMRAIVAPSPAASRLYVQYSLQESIIDFFYRQPALDPGQLSIPMFAFAHVLVLASAGWQRSSIKRDRLLLIFRDDAHFQEVRSRSRGPRANEP